MNLNKRQKQLQEWKIRQEKIEEMVLAGLSYVEIGKLLGLRKQAVYMIIRRNGLTKPSEVKRQNLQSYLENNKVK